MFKRVLCTIILFMGLLYQPDMSDANTPVVKKGRDYYIAKYLQVFTNLTPAEVLTVIKVESDGNPNTISLEPNVNDKSYGPMCVLGKTARFMHFTGDLRQLCTWEHGLYYGMQFLSWKKAEACKQARTARIRRRHTWSLYNAGRLELVKRDGTWTYINQRYVNICEKYYKNLKKYDSDVKYCIPVNVVWLDENIANLGRD